MRAHRVGPCTSFPPHRWVTDEETYQESLAEPDHASRDVLSLNDVGDPGIEPGTSFLSGTRSTTEPITPCYLLFYFSILL